MSSKGKGIAFERDVKNLLESAGFFVARQAASLFPDLLAHAYKQWFLIECKLHGRMSSKEAAALVRLAARLDAIPMLAFREKGSSYIHIDRLDALMEEKKEGEAVQASASLRSGS